MDIKCIYRNKNNGNDKYLILNTEAKYFNKGPHNYCHFILGHLYQFYLQWTKTRWDLHKVNYNFIGLHNYHLKCYRQLIGSDPILNLINLNSNIKRPNYLFYDKIVKLKNIDNLMSNAPNFPDANGFHEFVINRLNITKSDPQFLTLVERSPKSDRSIINHKELKEKLQLLAKRKNLKFNNVILENYKNNFKSQLNLVYKSRIFIAQHGAALANVFFLPKNSTVVEITSSEYRRFEMIARARNLKYYEIRLQPTNELWPKNSHLCIDLEIITSLIENDISDPVQIIQ